MDQLVALRAGHDRPLIEQNGCALASERDPAEAGDQWPSSPVAFHGGLSQSRCNPAGSSVAANPLSNSVNPIPAAVAARLAYSWPLNQILHGYGKYAHTFTNAGPNTSSTR
jgi:hypothetical protein